MLTAVTFDAGFTLIEHVEPPERFVGDACERLGVDAAPERVAGALARARPLLGDPAGTWGCDSAIARSLRAYYGAALEHAGAPPRPDAVDAIVESYTAPSNWRAVRGARDTLLALRERGLRIGVVANWQSTLERTLEACGLAALADAVVASALVGAGKPDPSAFLAACRRLDVPPAAVLHVGDDDRTDGSGALAAGCSYLRVEPSARMRAASILASAGAL